MFGGGEQERQAEALGNGVVAEDRGGGVDVLGGQRVAVAGGGDHVRLQELPSEIRGDEQGRAPGSSDWTQRPCRETPQLMMQNKNNATVLLSKRFLAFLSN